MRSAALTVALLALATPAHAYIDPSAGSLVLQMVLGGIAGVLVAVRLYWKRLSGLFRRGRDRPR